jgi:UDP:flavonoid glycosyltransferase YjiC (YdhE family)
MAEETGHPFLAGGEPSESEVRPIRERLPILPPSEASVLGNRELFGRLATSAMLEPMERALFEWQPDVVLRDPCEYASAVAAARLDIPTAQVAIGLAEVEWASTELAGPALEAHLKGLVALLLQSPYLTRFPATLDPSPFADTRRFREPRPERKGELPHWWADSSMPLVYVSFGTVLGHMSIADEVYQAAIDAVAGLDIRVLMTVGRRFDRSRLTALPTNVRIEPWIDQADVLAEAALVVCHGGSGTTFGALAAGVPLVVVPVFADQFANSLKVIQAGAGLVVATDEDAQGRRRPVSRVDAPEIRQAIVAALADGAFAEAAKTVSAEMSAEPSIETTIEEFRTLR